MKIECFQMLDWLSVGVPAIREIPDQWGNSVVSIIDSYSDLDFLFWLYKVFQNCRNQSVLRVYQGTTSQNPRVCWLMVSAGFCCSKQWQLLRTGQNHWSTSGWAVIYTCVIKCSHRVIGRSTFSRDKKVRNRKGKGKKVGRIAHTSFLLVCEILKTAASSADYYYQYCSPPPRFQEMVVVWHQW